MALERLLGLMAERKASDLFLAAGSPITIKINGVCVPINQEKMAAPGDRPVAARAPERRAIP